MPLRMYNLPNRRTCRETTTDKAAPPEGLIIHEQAFLACEGCLWPQAAESAELHIRLYNKGRQLIANLLKRQIRHNSGRADQIG